MAIYLGLACSFLLVACSSSSITAQAALEGRARSLLQNGSDVNAFSDLAEDSTAYEEVCVHL